MVLTRAQKTKNAILADQHKSFQRLMDDYCTPLMPFTTLASQRLNGFSNEDFIPPLNMDVPGPLPTQNSCSADKPTMDLGNEDLDISFAIGNWSLDPGLLENLSWPEVNTCESPALNNLNGESFLPETIPQNPQSLHDGNLHSLCVQMRNQCLLQAKTSKKIFDDLNIMHQEIVGLKSLIHLFAKFLSDGILRVAPPDELLKNMRKESISPLLTHGDKAESDDNGPSSQQDLTAGKYDGPQYEMHDILQAPTTSSESLPTQSNAFPDDVAFNLTFSNKDLVVVDDWDEANSIINMTCYDKKLRQTGPEQLDGQHEVIAPPLLSRVNGWSPPLHSFQLISLVLYTYLAVVIGVVFVHHLITHLVAITIDPADQNILAKKNYNKPMPSFDRSRCKHVIQNQHCYLCEVDVGPKTKHCSTCNKCVEEFDHHCNWLNNCVGNRNYWFFFNAVASAVVGIFLLMLVILYVFIQYFVDPAQLRTSPQFESVRGNGTWLAFLPLAPVETTAVGILVVAVVTMFFGFASFLLLGHLLLFHLYLSE
ncbi:hypothetical protein lerEdw1_001868 [Lerista edwardsae]|nr:hypothetical protein lerEdw1_001868 [Lerista edwardsae]